MLHHYELGLLPDEDRTAFELHLYDCDSCLEELERFRAAARLMKHGPEVRETIRELSSEFDSNRKARPAETADAGPSRRRRLSFIPLIVASAAIVLLLILQPWRIRIEPTQEAVAAENSVAVMYFENFEDPDDSLRLGEIVSNLIITDLSESQYIKVLSSLRLYDILRLIGREGEKRITKDVAGSIAKKADAKWIVMGGILQTDPRIVITVQIVDAASGEVRSSQRVVADEGDDIFAAADGLSAQLRQALPLPRDARDEPDKSVTDITTLSSAAYRHYVEGVEQFVSYYMTEAGESFTKAVEIDSTFAMAYYYLSQTVNPEFIYKAVLYSDRAGHRDRTLILSRHASISRNMQQAIALLEDGLKRYPDDKEMLYQLGRIHYAVGDLEQAINCLEGSVAVDPFFEQGYNLLAYVCSAADKFDRALESVNQYASLAPDEPNPYDSRGDLYATYGLLREAAESYETALAKDPEFFASKFKLGGVYLADRRFEDARAYYERIASDDDTRSRISARKYLALIPLLQGKVKESLRLLKEGLVTDSAEAGELWNLAASTKHTIMGRIYAGLRQYDLAADEILKGIEYNNEIDSTDRVFYRSIYSEYLIESGNPDSARAIMMTLKSEPGTAARQVACVCDYTSAMLDRASGNLESARELLKLTVENCGGTQFRFAYVKVLIESGMFAEAADELTELRKSRGLHDSENGFHVSLVPYLLGVSYEGLGNKTAAIQYYREFLDNWSEGDSDIFEIGDARIRIQKLVEESVNASS